MAEKKETKTATATKPATRPSRAFWGHGAFVLFVACYFSGLLYWFGMLFLTGGAAEHAVMSIVIPAVVVIGLVALVTLSTIALEGRRVASTSGEQKRASPADRP